MCAQHERSAKGNHRQNGEKHPELSHVLLLFPRVYVCLNLTCTGKPSHSGTRGEINDMIGIPMDADLFKGTRRLRFIHGKHWDQSYPW